MRNLIDIFTNQIKEAIEIGVKAKLSANSNPIQNVLICGLGGSGIGGSLVQNLTLKNSKVPIILNKSYELPSFVSTNTLVIISSYSGNTEETVSCLKSALKLDCKIVCISSGGKVEELSKENNLDFIKIPGGHPPRACLGYSSVQLFFVLNFFKIIDSSFKNELEKTIELLDSEKTEIQKEAKHLAEKLVNKFPILYAADNFEAVAIRIRQQINENSKMLCMHNVVPEMNHNELVGWRIKAENQVVLFLRNKTDLPRIQSRMELNKTVINEYAGNVYEIWSKGESNIQRAFYTINLGDWLSLYLSELRQVDVIEVNVIDFLKEELAKEQNV